VYQLSFRLYIGTPKDSGISLQTVLELGPSIPLFGVCMGLQCIGEAFGGPNCYECMWVAVIQKHSANVSAF